MTKSIQRVLIGGASGLIGSALAATARRQSIEVTRLVRRPASDATEIAWNPADGANAVNPSLLEGFDGVVHLGGASVARRWTAQHKGDIVDSRVASTRALCSALASTRNRPKVLIVASGVGIYGNRGDEILTEQSAPGSGYLAELSVAWEAAAKAAVEARVRVVHLRLGVVLDRDGGALAKMLPVFRLGLGGWLGSGHHWMSWISLGDVLRAIFFLMDRDDLAGPFNGSSPNPVTNRDFTRALAHAVHRPALLPVPGAALRLIFGELADEALLASQRVLPQRLLQAGFVFADEEIGATLRALLG